jgi:hypothetical protein
MLGSVVRGFALFDLATQALATLGRATVGSAKLHFQAPYLANFYSAALGFAIWPLMIPR